MENPEVNTDEKSGTVTAEFEAERFSEYAVFYTVDFYYGAYEFHLNGGESMYLSELFGQLNMEENAADVTEVEFTDPELLKINRDTEKRDWQIESVKPFDTEETLTIRFEDGHAVVLKVTDAQEIPDAEASTIDVNKSYLICYTVGEQYYLLKNDGTVDNRYTPDQFEGLNSTYCWTFNYIFKENDIQNNLDKNYYLIRPIDNKSKTIALNHTGEALVQQSNNTVAVFQEEGPGFKLEGYHNVGTEQSPRYIRLGFTDGAFAGVDGEGITIHIYEMDNLPTYDYTVRSADEARGSVTVSGGTQRTETQDGKTVHYYDASSTRDKKNAGTISAVPVDHRDGNGQNKWEFDHWEQNGVPLDRDQYPATIAANTLPISFNGSSLVAYFRQNSQYTVPNNEKEPSTFEDMTNWFNDLTTRHIPLDEAETKKTAEVYDYENRIYRVDISSKANFETFDGNVDMAFCLDVSNSMKFPSKLVQTTTNYNNHTNPIPIYQINNQGRYQDRWGNWHQYDNRNWLDQSRGYSNPYYLIADPDGTATVFKIYYKEGEWRAIDASRENDNDSTKWFKIGNSFETNWTSGVTDKTHPFESGDDNNSTYIIYDAGDSGRNRFYYLNQSLLGATTDLQTIKNTLAVAGSQSPQVRVAYNTFHKDLGNQRQNFQVVNPLTIDFTYSAGGGTRPDQAFIDAKNNFSWLGNDRYVILITDGAPQGIRTGESNNTTISQIISKVREEAQNLKDAQHVKFITIGLSMENVTEGKRLLYDLADEDKDGNKMFYMAESASDLPNILRQVTKTIMDKAIVYADVTDTVGEAFYPVDKATGLQLMPNDMIDIEGCKTSDSSQAAGIIQADGVTIKWLNQAIDPTNGWHGAIYVKAKEDLLGGNAVRTNDNAKITAEKYRMGDTEYTFNDSLLGDKLKSLEIDFPSSPRVNVNELNFSNIDTEWTVYLGAEVDPKEQLKRMYESVQVEKVVNEDDSLHYSISPNSISDDRDETDTSGIPAAFSLASTILEIIKNEGVVENSEIVSGSKYLDGDKLNWDAFLADLLDGGVTVPYHPYGIEGADSSIVISLTKVIQDGEEADLVNNSPHTTTVVNDNDEVEKYVLTVKYNPDYAHVLPIGQGGGGTLDYHTGTFGTMYQGHPAGRETSTNTHTINVFDAGLRITKTDTEGKEINKRSMEADETKFKLYRVVPEGTPGSTQLKVGDTQSVWVETVVEELSTIDALSSNEHRAMVDLRHLPELLGSGEFYLEETRAPEGYMRLAYPVKIELTMPTVYTDVNNSILTDFNESTATEPYNKTQQITSLKFAGTEMVDLENPVSLFSATVENTPAYELPSSGGPGTYLFTVFGVAVGTSSGMLFISEDRRQRLWRILESKKS